MKQERCYRCNKLFSQEYKSSHGRRRICPKCRLPRWTNKGKNEKKQEIDENKPKEKATEHIRKNCPSYFKLLEQENRLFEGSLISDALDMAISLTRKQIVEEIKKMEIKTEKELWDEFTEYDCGDSGTEFNPYFNGDKEKKWVAVDDLIKRLKDKE